jgi:hypothetical protein
MNRMSETRLGSLRLRRRLLQYSIWAFLVSGPASSVSLADEVTDWNKAMLQATLTAPAIPAPVAIRAAAIVQAAVFDAVNGIDRSYMPLYVRPGASAAASKRAAAVQAAYVTLVKLFPNQKATLDEQRAASLAGITDSSNAIEQGLSWGQNVADEIWAWRSQDGFSNVLPPYLGGTEPGQWRPTPPALAPGLVPQLATTTPWVILSPSQFRPQGPVALTSDQYTADLNEVKRMGSSTNSARTAEQTLYANFWQAGHPPDNFDQVITSLAEQHQFPMSKTAWSLALVNIAMADSAIGCYDAKYQYNFWRPVTAIRLADSDGNEATAPDAGWTPLIVTPPHPDYLSGHSCATAAATRILSQIFGEMTSFSVGSTAMPGVTRKFYSFSAALEEVKNARILAGIHFRTACVDGAALGYAVADYVTAHAMLPLEEHGRDR